MKERDHGLAALRRGEFDEAIEHLERARAADPDDIQVLHYLGGAYHQTKRDEEAVYTLSRLVIQRPDEPHAYYNLAISLDRIWRRQDAVAALRRALELKPDYRLAQSVLQRWQEEAASPSAVPDAPPEVEQARDAAVVAPVTPPLSAHAEQVRSFYISENCELTVQDCLEASDEADGTSMPVHVAPSGSSLSEQSVEPVATAPAAPPLVADGEVKKATQDLSPAFEMSPLEPSAEQDSDDAGQAPSPIAAPFGSVSAAEEANSAELPQTPELTERVETEPTPEPGRGCERAGELQGGVAERGETEPTPEPSTREAHADVARSCPVVKAESSRPEPSAADEEAVYTYSQRVALQPDAYSYYNLALSLDRVWRRQEAITALQRALKLKPDYPLAQSVLQRWQEEAAPPSAVPDAPPEMKQTTDAADEEADEAKWTTDAADEKAEVAVAWLGDEIVSDPAAATMLSANEWATAVLPLQSDRTKSDVAKLRVDERALAALPTEVAEQDTDRPKQDWRRRVRLGYREAQSTAAELADAAKAGYEPERTICPGTYEAMKLALCSLFFVGLVFGPIAISKAVTVRRWIAASDHWYGDNIAIAAIVIGGIGMLASLIEIGILFAFW